MEGDAGGGGRGLLPAFGARPFDRLLVYRTALRLYLVGYAKGGGGAPAPLCHILKLAVIDRPVLDVIEARDAALRCRSLSPAPLWPRRCR